MHTQPQYRKNYADYRRAMMRYANRGTIPAGVDPHHNSVTDAYDELARFENPNHYNDTGGKPMSQQHSTYSNEDQNLVLPDTVSDLFPSKWLCAGDLGDRTFDLVIERIEPGMFPIHPRTREKELKAVAYFAKAKKGLILNATQCTQIAEIAESERFDAWPGTRVTLAPGKAPNGKPTITIRTAPAPAPAAEKPEAAPETATEDPAQKHVDALENGREEKLPADARANIDTETGEIFDYRYKDGSPVIKHEQATFDSYRRAHDEAIPASRGALIDWTYAVKTAEIVKDNLS